MELKEKIPDPGTEVKVTAVLILALGIGFIASSFGDNQMMQSSSGEDLSYDAPVRTEADGNFREKESVSGSQENTRKIVTEVRTTLRVPDVEAAMNTVKSEADKSGGFVESSSIDRDLENRGRMTVRVPDENLSEFESSLEQWRVESRNVDREDVTDSYDELEAEIESLRTEYDRLQQLINKTDDVSTLIDIQERLSEVRSRLDYKQRRLENLQQDVEYSTVDITFEGPQSIESRFDLRETFSKAYQAVFDSIKLIIIGAAYLLPFGLIYLVYRGTKNLRKKF